MKKTIFSFFFSLIAFIFSVHSYVDCNPYDYRQGLEDYQSREQERLDRLPQQQRIHPDGNGGYYYFK